MGAWAVQANVVALGPLTALRISRPSSLSPSHFLPVTFTHLIALLRFEASHISKHSLPPNLSHIIPSTLPASSPDVATSSPHLSSREPPPDAYITMPTRTRYNTSTDPVIVEVTPTGIASRSTNTPPSSPGSPKAVRFAPDALVKLESRPLTVTEAWPLYHFECHALRCRACYISPELHSNGRRLCASGDILAKDVAEHVYYKDGDVYSRKKDNHKLVRVQLPPKYTQVLPMLKSRERAIKTTHKIVPIISYAPPAARQVPELEVDSEEPERRTVVVEPASSERVPRRSPKHSSDRYGPVVIEENHEVSSSSTSSSRHDTRGSLYHNDEARRRQGSYRVVIREPERRESRRDQGRERERPRSMFWS